MLLCSVLGGAIFHEPVVSEGSGSMVIVRNIEFASTSEADLLPFYGRCHVAYVPSNGVVLGLSKLARVTKLFARQLQSQQRLTDQVLVALQQGLAPKGAAIVVEARHLAHGPEADLFMTSASSGCFQDITSSCMQARFQRQDAPLYTERPILNANTDLVVYISCQLCSPACLSVIYALSCLLYMTTLHQTAY